MKSSYGVMEVKTGVVLVEGTYEYCEKWIRKNCHYNKKYGFWKDADHEQVSITLI